MSTVHYVLSPGDSAKATEIATAINSRMEPLNRQVISRYGMDIFQNIVPTFTLASDFTYILYHFPGVMDYVHDFIADDDRMTAFENEVALRVHLHCTRSRTLPTEILALQPKEGS